MSFTYLSSVITRAFLSPVLSVYPSLHHGAPSRTVHVIAPVVVNTMNVVVVLVVATCVADDRYRAPLFHTRQRERTESTSGVYYRMHCSATITTDIVKRVIYSSARRDAMAYRSRRRRRWRQRWRQQSTHRAWTERRQQRATHSDDDFERRGSESTATHCSQNLSRPFSLSPPFSAPHRRANETELGEIRTHAFRAPPLRGPSS